MEIVALIFSVTAVGLCLYLLHKDRDRKNDAKIDLDDNQITFRDKKNKAFLTFFVTGDQVQVINKDRKVVFKSRRACANPKK